MMTEALFSVAYAASNLPWQPFGGRVPPGWWISAKGSKLCLGSQGPRAWAPTPGVLFDWHLARWESVQSLCPDCRRFYRNICIDRELAHSQYSHVSLKAFNRRAHERKT